MRSIVVAAIRGDRLTCIFPASIPQPAPRSGAPQVSWIPTYAEIRAAAPRETAFCRSEVAFCEAEQDHRDTPFTVRRVPSVGAPCRAGGGLTRMVLFVALMTPEGGAERDRERRQRRLRSGETVLANSTADNVGCAACGGAQSICSPESVARLAEGRDWFVMCRGRPSCGGTRPVRSAWFPVLGRPCARVGVLTPCRESVRYVPTEFLFVFPPGLIPRSGDSVSHFSRKEDVWHATFDNTEGDPGSH